MDDHAVKEVREREGGGADRVRGRPWRWSRCGDHAVAGRERERERTFRSVQRGVIPIGPIAGPISAQFSLALTWLLPCPFLTTAPTSSVRHRLCLAWPLSGSHPPPHSSRRRPRPSSSPMGSRCPPTPGPCCSAFCGRATCSCPTTTASASRPPTSSRPPPGEEGRLLDLIPYSTGPPVQGCNGSCNGSCLPGWSRRRRPPTTACTPRTWCGSTTSAWGPPSSSHSGTGTHHK